MTVDRPLLGIALMLGFCVLAPFGDAVAKLLGAVVPLGFVVLIRFAVQALILIPLVWYSNRAWRMRGRVLWLTVVRTILHIIGIAAMFTGLKYIPLADAIAIVFVMPFLMLLLGRYFLGEEVGPRRLIACTVGFIGVLLVIQPSFADVGWPALLPLCGAISFAFFMLTTRKIAKETDPIGLQAGSGVMATAIMLPALLIGNGLEFAPLMIISPDSYDWTLLIGMGLIGTAAHLLMTWSLRFAPGATLAPMQYLEIPFAVFLGYAIFGDFPNGLATVGILITMAAGIYVILRERAIARIPVPKVFPQPAE